ncbi:helix-turn-helix domain-containing protein [Acholeplasma granularum]|uniref:helix-turn-helix domain-containing protein n=1 Tax=Acholeplasma granularum TaxID=264635 RepID=UPI00046FA7C9|nr:helix-turn-helix transcriptional regulator [Acholeplasma granularum]
MPEIIDNIKVAEKIKKLLKENQMTQDDLANKLSITKSAVSQNLRGKSTFDIQNLILIAQMFNMSLDELLSLEDETSPNFSEYQKVVSKGMDAFKGHDPKNLNIKTPDIYGKVLIDYIIEQKEFNMFKYLNDEKVEFVETYYHRQLEIYLKIIIFMLENNLGDIHHYVLLYQKLEGSFKIKNELLEKMVWGLLDMPQNNYMMSNLYTQKPNLKERFKFIKEPKINRVISKNDLLEMISKYKLKNILNQIIHNLLVMEDLKDVVTIFSKYSYIEGITIFINHFIKEKLPWLKKVSLDVQKLYLMILELNNLDLILLFAQKSIYTDLTVIIKKLIQQGQVTFALELINEFEEELVYKEIALTAINNNQIDFLENILPKLKNDDLNYLFSQVKDKNINMLIFLIKNGAKVEEKYYNFDTFKKINLIFEEVIKKGDK